MRRLHPLRGPDLLPVDDPLAAVGRQFATRPHTREVRSRAGLGIALAPDIIAFERLADEELLLRFGALFEQGGHGPVHAVSAPLHRRTRTDEFLADHLSADDAARLPGPAMALGDRLKDMALIDRARAAGEDELQQICT